MTRDFTGGERARGMVRALLPHRAAVLFLTVLAMAFGTFFLSSAEAQTYRFGTIRVEGNVLADEATVLGLAGIAPGATVSAGELNAAYQNLMRSGIFETVEVVPQGGTLVLRVREYPIVNRISIEGNRRIDDEDLAPLLSSRSNRVYSPSQAEADARAIAAAYFERGRIGAEVTPRIIDRGNARVDLVFEVREGRVVEIERLSFVGNRAFSDRRLRRVLETTQAGLLRTIIQRDTFLEPRVQLDQQLLTDFYLSRGYIDFEVLSVTPELTRERDAMFLTFSLREGLPYRIGAVSVESELDGIDLAPYRAEVRLRSGVTYSPTVIEANVQRLERIATEQGRRFVRVEPRVTRNEAAQTVDVAFTLVQGERITIERIDIQGNTTTLDRVIRRQFRVVEGDPLNPREIRAAAERIRALGYFSNSSVTPRRGTTEDQVIVDVQVEEGPTGSLGFGVSYGVSAGVGFNVNFSEANFLGRGQRFDFALAVGGDSQDSRISFVEPAFLGRDLRLGFDVYYRTTDQQFARYNTDAAGFSVSLGFPVSQYARLDIRYTLGGIELSEASDVAFAALPRAIRDDIEEGAVITSSLGATYTYDTRRNGPDPQQGFVLRFGADLAGLGGDREYLQATALAGYERRILGDEVTLRAELELGALSMITGNSRTNERFTLSSRLRGFEPNGLGPFVSDGSGDLDFLGGNYFAVARFEADFPLGLPDEYGISGGVFWDVGSLWDVGGIAADAGETIDDSAYWRSSVGVSIFWDTPIGPLRFNFSRPVRSEDWDRTQNFDLSINTRF